MPRLPPIQVIGGLLLVAGGMLGFAELRFSAGAYYAFGNFFFPAVLTLGGLGLAARGALNLHRFVTARRRQRRVEQGSCPRCCYPFIASTPERCAECGYNLAAFLGKDTVLRIQQELARNDN